uniref:Uncharacterized protein n=1 Tax=Spumella elongata TaxID=89044 RepID=A0A7S3MGY2_9STRA|mmetsp:Transcript_63586/g.112311  ORF Transcript_63586/g.112311 Transcript_63586/m.112311 type:complete len:234 (+) Transcript_63586:2-703(+)
MDDGRKVHIKFYVLLVGMEDAVRWHLYTFKDGYLSISPNPWTPEDLSKETQVTIIRSERITGWAPWPEVYPKCRAGVASVIKKAVDDGKLEGRIGKRQFEIFSADFLVDTHGAVWFFEFNMSPVLKDAADAPKVNDSDMIRGALNVVSPWEGGGPGLWDFVQEFSSPPEVVAAARASKASPAQGSGAGKQAAAPGAGASGGDARRGPPAAPVPAPPTATGASLGPRLGESAEA